MASRKDKLENLRISGVTETGEELGRGAYATVLKLKYRGLKCAGKKLHGLYGDSSEGGKERNIQRFNEECQLLADLKHPNVVQFLGVHLEKVTNAPILVMEYLQTTLAICLDTNRSLPTEMCYSILKDVATALCYLHGSNPPIIHRDMSANNVLLTSNMTAKLADLGMAKILNLTPAQKHHMTTCPGTLAYMPPEALEHDPEYSTSIDCFSYGVLILHIFTGEWPIPDAQVRRDKSGKRILSEVERREKYLKIIECDHPIINSLVLQCLADDDRPNASDILQLVEEEAHRFPPVFQNSLEMFRENQALRSLREDTDNQGDESDSTENPNTLTSVEQNTLTQETTIQGGREEKTVDFRARSESLRSENQELQAKLDEIKSIKDTQTECHIRTVTTENMDLKAKMESANQEILSQSKQLEVWQAELKSKEKQLEITANMLQTKDSQLFCSEETASVLTQSIESSKKEILAKHRELEAKDKEIEKMQGAFESINDQLNELHTQNECMQSRLQSSEKECELKVKKLELMQEEMKQISAEKEELKKELECKIKTIGIKNSEIDNLQTILIPHLESQIEVKEDTIQLLSQRQKLVQDYIANKKDAALCFSFKTQVEACADLPIAMSDPQCAVVNDTVYVGGGLTDTKADSKGQGEVFEYNPQEDKWNTLPMCPTRRFGLSQYCGRLLTIGGIKKSNTFSGSVYSFNSSTNDWEEDPISPFPTKRFFPAVVSYRSVLAICGGVIQGGSLTDNVEVFSDGRWHTASRLPHRCALAKPVVIGDSCYLMGGYFSIDPDVPSKAVASINLSRLTSTQCEEQSSPWELHSDEECRMTQYKSVPANCGGVLLAIGGWDQNELASKSNILVYSFHTGMWVKMDDLPTPRSASSATVQLQNGSIMIAGGITEKNKKTASTLLLSLKF